MSAFLPSGLSYVVRRHAVPAGQVFIRLQLDAGSLDEDEGARGVAGFTARLALAAAAQGVSGRDLAQLARPVQGYPALGYAQPDYQTTSFTLTLDGWDEPRFAAALAMLSDLLRPSLLDEATAARLAPDVIRHEGSRRHLAERLAAGALAGVLEGSKAASHPPSASEADLCRIDPAQVLRFHRAWYTAPCATLIVVGDAPTTRVIDLISRELGGLVDAPAPLRRAVREAGPAAQRAVVITDPELVAATAELVVAQPSAGPTRTIEDLRRETLDALAGTVLRRRLSANSPGQAPLREPGVFLGEAPPGIRLALISASGDARGHAELVQGLIRAARSAVKGPVDDHEFQLALDQLRAEGDRNAASEGQLPSTQLLDLASRSLAFGTSLMAPSQRRQLTAPLLERLAPDDVARTIESSFDLDRAAIVLLSPPAPDLPSSDALLETVRAAQALELAPEPAQALVPDIDAPLLVSRPDPGSVTDLTLHPASGVTSAWLSNGVRVHHRAMTARPGQVHLVISVIGGRIEETDASRGLSTAAATVLGKAPAARSASHARVESALTRAGLTFTAQADSDALVLEISGDRDDIDAMAQFAYLLLAQPMLEANAFDDWRWRAERQARARAASTWESLADAFGVASFPAGDLRATPLREEELRALDVDRAQRWLDDLFARAPIEAAIVGDIDRGAALDAAQSFLGALTQRPRPAPEHLAPLRALGPASHPTDLRQRRRSSDARAGVLLALPGPDAEDLEAVAALEVAGALLRLRADAACARAASLAQSVVGVLKPAQAYPGHGVLLLAGLCDPIQADRLLECLRQTARSLAAAPPTGPEFDAARREVRAAAEQNLGDPLVWARRLAELSSRARRIDDLLTEPARIGATTPAQIGDHLARALEGDGQGIIIIPDPRSEPPAPPAPDTPAPSAP